MFAGHEEGNTIAQTVHEQLKDRHVWVWPQGCIEDVTGADSKGENAIMEQVEQLRSMSAEEIEKEMPAFKACFDWIQGL